MKIKNKISTFLITFLFLASFDLYSHPTLDNLWDYDTKLKTHIAPTPWSQWHQDLRPGDVIMVPLNCWVCRLIEAEIGRPFSHSALVLGVSDQGEVFLAEALGEVRVIELSRWAKFLRGDAPWVVVRPEFKNFYQELSDENLSQYFFNVFYQKFKDLSFDPTYTWDSFDQAGNRTLYCSEFIYHFLSPYLLFPLELGVASYQRHIDLWLQYFGGEIPDLGPGVNPGAFFDASGFEVVKWQKAQTK